MINNKKIVALIPARLGSVRVQCKTLRLILGKPLIYYIIQNLKQSKSFDVIYVNSESELIGEVAKRYGIKFYKRPKELATSSSMIDDYIYEFLCNIDCDVLAVVNPTSPLLSTNDIDDAVNQFMNSDCDTQLCCEKILTHCFVKGNAINYSTDGQHPRSQDLEPVLALNFGITIWDSNKFVDQYKSKGHGVYTGKLGFYITDGFSSVDIDYDEDFVLAKLIMENKESFENADIEYDNVLNELISSGVNTKN